MNPILHKDRPLPLLADFAWQSVPPVHEHDAAGLDHRDCSDVVGGAPQSS